MLCRTGRCWTVYSCGSVTWTSVLKVLRNVISVTLYYTAHPINCHVNNVARVVRGFTPSVSIAGLIPATTRPVRCAEISSSVMLCHVLYGVIRLLARGHRTRHGYQATGDGTLDRTWVSCYWRWDTGPDMGIKPLVMGHRTGHGCQATDDGTLVMGHRTGHGYQATGDGTGDGTPDRTWVSSHW